MGGRQQDARRHTYRSSLLGELTWAGVVVENLPRKCGWLLEIIVAGNRLTETWKDIPGFEGLYEASDLGRVRNARTGYVLKPFELKAGGVTYLTVTLYRKGEKKDYRVHNLVALTFLGPCPEGQETRHGVGRNLCNELWNLSYGTHLENRIDRKRDGTETTGSNDKTPCRVRRDDGVEFISTRAAARSCGSVSCQFHIVNVCRGRRKTAYGHKWSYCNNFGGSDARQ